MAFEKKFKEFHVARKMHQDLETPYDKVQADKALSFDKWSLPQWDLFKIVLDKEILTIKKNWSIPVFGLIMVS